MLSLGVLGGGVVLECSEGLVFFFCELWDLSAGQDLWYIVGVVGLWVWFGLDFVGVGCVWCFDDGVSGLECC